MGIQGRIDQQPDYLELLKNRAYYRALISKLGNERNKYFKQITENKEDSEVYKKAFRLNYHILLRIEELTIYMSEKIDKPTAELEKYYKSIKASDSVKKSIDLNMVKMGMLEQEYITQVKALPLLKFDENDVKQWILDASSINLKPYNPTSLIKFNASRSLTLSSTPNRVVLDLARVPVKFVYADGTDEIVSDRYVVYWKYLTGGKDGQLVPASKEVMLPVGVGHTDLMGNLFQSFPMDNAKSGIQIYEAVDKDNKIIHSLESLSNETFNSIWKDKNDPNSTKYDAPLIYNTKNCPSCHYNSNSSLSIDEQQRRSQVLTEEYNDELRKSFAIKLEQRLSLAKFDSSSEYGFFLYPMDHGRMHTVDLHKLTSMPVPSGSTAKNIAYKGKLSKDKTIALHCTLPEWDNRLQKALDDANYSFQLIEIAQSVHRQQERKIGSMIAAINAQLKFPYSKQNTTEFKTRKEMLTNLVEAKNTIHERYTTTFNNTHGRKSGGLAKKEAIAISVIKENFNSKLEVLYKLITNKALKSEIELYNKITLDKLKNKEIPSKGKIDKETGKPVDEHFSGPYMEYEPEWTKIVSTIADCYAMLSNSSKFKNEIWKNDVKFAMDVVMNIKSLDVVFKNWPERIKKLDDPELIKDFNFDELYSNKQKEEFQQVASKTVDPNASLSASIMSNYVDILDLERIILE